MFDLHLSLLPSLEINIWATYNRSVIEAGRAGTNPSLALLEGILQASRRETMILARLDSFGSDLPLMLSWLRTPINAVLSNNTIKSSTPDIAPFVLRYL